eukprot:TRINITY_DN5831_c0_g1_i1.p1 TRINITY_DN5831_c0_g1~~TRINITY_DN5831_c0_g1_i1.p1  ORF type:complete len:615 (-),score=119.57 TRINITY_DN5831_c0_g1_i1:2-1846(-)
MGEALSDAAGCCTSRDHDGTEPIERMPYFQEDDAKVQARGGGIGIHSRVPAVSADLVRRAIANEKGGEKFDAAPINPGSVCAELLRRVLVGEDGSAAARVDLLRQNPGCEHGMKALKAKGLAERRQHLSPSPLAINADLLRHALAKDGCDGIGERYQQKSLVPVNVGVATPQLVRQVLGMPPSENDETHERSVQKEKEKSLADFVSEALERYGQGQPLTQAYKASPSKVKKEDRLRAGPTSPLIISAGLVRRVLASDGSDIVAGRHQTAPLNTGVVTVQILRQVLGMPPEDVNEWQEKSSQSETEKSLTGIVGEALERHGQGKPLRKGAKEDKEEDPLIISADLVRRVLASDGSDVIAHRYQAAPLNGGVVSAQLLRQVLGMPPEDVNEWQEKSSQSETEKSLTGIVGEALERHGQGKPLRKGAKEDKEEDPLIISADLVRRVLASDGSDVIAHRYQAAPLNGGVVSAQLLRQVLGMPPEDINEPHGSVLKQSVVVPQQGSKGNPLQAGPVRPLMISADLIKQILVGDDCNGTGKKYQAVNLNAGIVTTQLVRQVLGMPPIDSSERNWKPSEEKLLAEGPIVIPLSVSADLIRHALSAEPVAQREESTGASKRP